jgi:hypothetical protein
MFKIDTIAIRLMRKWYVADAADVFARYRRRYHV